MYAHNSTIKIKMKECVNCGQVRPIFSKRRCKDCARIEDGLAKMEEGAKEYIKKEKLSELIDIADDYWSKVVRLSAADENGWASCFTCDQVLRWQEMQCGHYMKRGNLFLRFDARNCRVQCQPCNEHKGGNMAEYTRRLEAEQSGITEILRQEAALVYSPSRSEIQAIITECKQKIKSLKKPN